MPDINKPFISANLQEHGYRCSWERDTLFTHIYKGSAVPIRCHRCYKVVLAPTSLADVLAIEAYQAAGEHPAKVGMEIRPTVKRVWGAYWYTNSVEEGLERYREVKEWARGGLSDPFTLILKHGCTEFEQTLGPSDRWKIEPWQHKFEEMISEHVVPLEPTSPQPENVKAHIRKQWKKWDQLMRPVVTYHEQRVTREMERRLRQMGKGKDEK
jgi:hypothetical protein